MDKYTKVIKPREPAPANCVRVSALGRVGTYITYAAGLFSGRTDGDTVTAPVDTISVEATGNAMPKAVHVIEILKRRVKGLHQISELGTVSVQDTYEPNEEGMEQVVKTKVLSVLHVTLSTAGLDTAHPGYQPPLDDDQVEELSPEEMLERGRKGKGNIKKAKKAKGAKGKGKGDKKEEAKVEEKAEETAAPKKRRNRKPKGEKKEEPEAKVEETAEETAAPKKRRNRKPKGEKKEEAKAEEKAEEKAEPKKRGRGKGAGKGEKKEEPADKPADKPRGRGRGRGRGAAAD